MARVPLPGSRTKEPRFVSYLSGDSRETETDDSARRCRWGHLSSFSPDGGTLAFSRKYVSRLDLYLLHLGKNYRPREDLKKVDTDNSWNVGVAWTPDWREIVFSSGNGTTQGLWRMDISKQGKPVRLGLPSDNASAPSISRTGKSLVYVAGKWDANIWRVDLEGPGRKPGTSVQFLSSTRQELEPGYSSDGKKIDFVSDRSGTVEIWICDSDGSNSQPLTSMRERNVEYPKWSPDNQRIAFQTRKGDQSDLYVISSNGGSHEASNNLTRQERVCVLVTR